jgi:hypothetical protein
VRAIEVEGNTNKPTKIFPFSKPSPFSSMTDWPLDSQQTMTKALQHPLSTKKLKNHDPPRGTAPGNHQIRKNNARTTPTPKRLKRSQKLQKNDET